MEPITVPVRFPNGEERELKLVKDGASFTGFSLLSLSNQETPGTPASLFLVVVMKAYKKLDLTCRRQRALIDKLERTVNLLQLMDKQNASRERSVENDAPQGTPS